MVNGGFLKVANCVVDYTEVDMGEELSSDIGYLLMLCVIVDGVLHVVLLRLAHLHVVDTDTVVG